VGAEAAEGVGSLLLASKDQELTELGENKSASPSPGTSGMECRLLGVLVPDDEGREKVRTSPIECERE